MTDRTGIEQDFSTGLGPWHVKPIDWTYGLHPVNKPSDEFGMFSGFKARWDSKRKSDLLPGWKDFELSDFEPWWGSLALEDILPGPQYDTVFRLWGTYLTRILDVELTGKTLRSTFGTAYNEIEIGLFERIVAEHLIVVSFGPMNWRHFGNVVLPDKVSFIQMPLATNGKDVDKILSLVLELDQDTPFSTKD